jgi:AcrR family transcriptional regulator
MRTRVTGPGDDAVEETGETKPVRVDAQRNLDAPVREIAVKAGVGVGTLYRHFPLRSGLVAAVFRREIDACADAAPILAAEYAPGEALARWMQRYAAFIATKRGLASALHSGNPVFEPLPAYFQQRLEPALRTLLESAEAAGEVRTDISADELLSAVAGLCTAAYQQSPDQAERMVSLLVAGLRYGAARPEGAPLP